MRMYLVMARYYHIVEKAKADVSGLSSDSIMFFLLLKNPQEHFMAYWMYFIY